MLRYSPPRNLKRAASNVVQQLERFFVLGEIEFSQDAFPACGASWHVPQVESKQRKEYLMSRMKLVLAVLVGIAIVGLVPMQAQTVKVMIAGSSAMWNAMALGAYNGNATQGNCPTGSGATPPCFHYTSGANFNLTDNRPTVPVVDTGALWLVWDSTASPNVWAYLKVDSIVGVRCYFATPKCNVNVAAFPAVGNQISTTIWPDGSSDTLPPASVQALFTGAGVTVNVGATDVRPEDAAFSECRINSALGNGSAGGTGSGDGLDGLGYGTLPSGTCPTFASPAATKVGSPILSGYPGSTAKATPVAFNISGKDPFSNTTIPAGTTVSVGASPIIFVFERNGGQLANLTNATEGQLQTLFSGTNCNASVLGLPAANIQVYLREILSGTYSTAEYTVFRRPTVPASTGFLGLSQEKGVGANNPLATPCTAGGSRYRGIGTGEEVKSVHDSVATHGTDGIGYTFFSYANVSSIANSANYGYVTLNGVDPIFQTYCNAGPCLDPGQPTGGKLPAAANLPAACQPGGFPCAESLIWRNGFSFPNIRNGQYRSWSILRVISNGTGLTNIKQVITTAQKYVVNINPDYVPAVAVAGTTPPEVGLKFLRSHFQQKDGAGNNIGLAPINTGADKGGDAGGCILPTTAGVLTSKQTQLIQTTNADNSDMGCVLR
jgi:ABC-type phosphate transport system substrate-binding protein